MKDALKNKKIRLKKTFFHFVVVRSGGVRASECRTVKDLFIFDHCLRHSYFSINNTG
ncbi:Uncharacterized protein dnm_062670 [Desulfonema magnum]|uniref:Uncharacterized protein n=1 Tax=Desulfonema magnum TaxID=45655 RepID=A0A975GQM8_9BACT|nr:Uncharacterized protein dnm_062670 [Desulfonema magnum]